MGIKSKTKYTTPKTQFNPTTDLTLRYFTVKQAFVRKGESGSYKLFCDNGKCTPIFLAHDDFIYLYPALKVEHLQYVEAFLLEYAPQYPIEKVRYYLGKCHYEYIGKPEPIAL